MEYLVSYGNQTQRVIVEDDSPVADMEGDKEQNFTMEAVTRALERNIVEAYKTDPLNFRVGAVIMVSKIINGVVDVTKLPVMVDSVYALHNTGYHKAATHIRMFFEKSQIKPKKDF